MTKYRRGGADGMWVAETFVVSAFAILAILMGLSMLDHWITRLMGGW